MSHAVQCATTTGVLFHERIDVFQDAKAMLEHKVDIDVISIIGPGQGTDGKIVKLSRQRCTGCFSGLDIFVSK